MATIIESVEAARGCGFRKAGGIYLVTEGLSRACGKLPIPFEICPTCGAGIKPARGWTWIEPRPLIENRICKITDTNQSFCDICPIDYIIGRQGLLWIGEKYYSTPGQWTTEATQMGVSRRIKRVPRGFVLGKTWVFVAHIKAIPVLPKEGETKGTYTPAIFHVFKPSRIDYIVKGDESDEELEALEARGFTLVKVIPKGQEKLFDQ